MRLPDAWALVRQNVGRNPKHYIFAAVGIVVGVGMLSFFVALGMGVRARVLNTYFPANQIEVEPRRVGVLGVEGAFAHTEVTDERLVQLRALPGVSGVFPTQRSRFQARLWGGAGLFGRDAHAEAFFDGIEPSLIREDLRRFELGSAATQVENVEATHRAISCDTSEDCPAGFDCAESQCIKHELWTDFRSVSVATRCRANRDCPPGASLCFMGLCRATCASGEQGEGAQCVPVKGAGRARDENEARFPVCSEDTDCDTGLGCVPIPCVENSQCGGDGACITGRCTGPVRVCDYLRCGFPGGYKDQDRETPEAMAGELLGQCAEDEAVEGDECVPVPCPEGSYCAGDHAMADVGLCQRPLPVVLNPFLVDAFNATAASALNLSRIADPRILLGLTFRMRFGDSFFIRGEKRSNQQTRRITLVGFSDKAPMLGVSLPLNVVQHANAAYRGRDATRDYDAVILVTEQNEDMSGVIREVETLGFTLAPRSRDARKLSNMLLILTLIFAFISVVIMAIAAVNIAHIFLMIVAERRHEIGVLRSLGATGRDIRLLILIEAALVGFFGALCGHITAFALGGLTNRGIHSFLDGWMRLPEDFFVFEPTLILLSVSGAVVVAMLGAWAAAKRAANLDPARVLSNP